MPRFATTRWSLVAAAKDPAARQALAELCGLYWYPVYAFVRRRGHSADDAGDLTQEFFARLIAKAGIAGADPAKGRFRSYLLGAVPAFPGQRARPGGGEEARRRPDESGRSTSPTPSAATPPSRPTIARRNSSFERRWALTLLDGVLAGLRAEYVAAGQELLFDRLKSSLTGEAGLVCRRRPRNWA